MFRLQGARARAKWLGSAIVAASTVGCGGDAPAPEFKEADAPAVKGKDSMDYFRDNMLKKDGAAKAK